MTARGALALAALAGIALGGCHKREAAATLDAGADARARTAAKTLADLAAAEQASATALPRAVASPTQHAAPPASAAAAPVADGVENRIDPDL